MSSPANYRELSGDAHKALRELNACMLKSSIEPALVHLLYLRISQINGCAYCVDLHSHDALAGGENPQRLYNLTVWRETSFFTPRERAAFAWAEAMTRLPIEHPSEDLHDATRRAFTEKEFVDLTFVIATMNAFNRLGVGFKGTPARRN